MEGIDYGSLAQGETREAYFEAVMHGYPEPETQLDELLDYIYFLEARLEACGFDAEDATRSAADTVFGALGTFIREHGNGSQVSALHAMDALIRDAHGVREQDFPVHDDDPCVAAFYTKLEPHLNRPMAFGRVDQW